MGLTSLCWELGKEGRELAAGSPLHTLIAQVSLTQASRKTEKLGQRVSVHTLTGYLPHLAQAANMMGETVTR